MNDPHWRGHDGKPDTPDCPSPGIPVLTNNPNLGQYTAPTWPIAPYSEIKHFNRIKEGVFTIISKHPKLFSPEHKKEWDSMLNNPPSPGAVSKENQAEWHAKVTTVSSC